MINPQAVAPMFGSIETSKPRFQPEYLEYNTKGIVDRMFFNAGAAYLLGIGSGGAFGVLNGLQTAPNRRFRIVVNSVLNKSGRYGSRFGNAIGAVAMIYSLAEYAVDQTPVEYYVGSDEIVPPVIAATLTGLLYKSSQGPKTMALAGVLGGAAAAGFSLFRSYTRGKPGY